MTKGEEQVLFLRYLGAAVVSWSQVENALRSAVVNCFQEAEEAALSVGFFSIENFRSKLEYADKVIIKKLIDTPQLQYWPKLLDRTRRASVNRNKLVHGAAQYFPDNKPGRRMVLSPWIAPVTKKKTNRKMPANGSLGLLDIVGYGLEFNALFFALANFSFRMTGEGQFPESYEQPAGLPTIQTLVRQIREELGPPSKSSRV